MSHPRSRRRLAVAGALVGAALAAATLPAPIGAAAPARATAAPRCGALSLMADLSGASAGAGQRFVTISLTNVTRGACSLRGYPGLRLLDRRNRPLPTRIVPDRSRPVRLLVLAPGDSARSALRWSAIPLPGEPQSGPCEPNPARIAIRPPGAAHSLVRPWRLGPACAHGRIEVRPLS
jgi:hypothetical protein